MAAAADQTTTSASDECTTLHTTLVWVLVVMILLLIAVALGLGFYVYRYVYQVAVPAVNL